MFTAIGKSVLGGYRNVLGGYRNVLGGYRNVLAGGHMHTTAVMAPAGRMLMSTASAPKKQAAAAVDRIQYIDKVPAEAKEEIMDSLYCRMADKFDSVTNVLSFTLNKWWKRKLVERINAGPGDVLLDVAGGTCEIAKHYLSYQDQVNNDTTSTVHVVDFNSDMLRVGQHRLAGTQWMRDGRVTFAHGNAEALANVPDASVDIYSISAGMHNLPNPERALSEAHRVLKPGGKFACLEYGHVDTPVWGSIIRWYWDHGLPAVGGWLTGDRPMFVRLAQSCRAFPHQRDFAKAIRRAGIHLPGKGYELFQGGMVVLYVGTKPRK
ncbi:2-hexaprenyl-6-methoxy-1,4-benzoquinone methyltransferase [Coemansia sp. RSA 552]|nr:2-hexaprenyl-6-methoxy-1,4-benzoquinone methyltransferase [Coemansia sp. RSA 552]